MLGLKQNFREEGYCVGEKELMKLPLINLIGLCCIDLHILPVDLLILLYACTFLIFSIMYGCLSVCIWQIIL